MRIITCFLGLFPIAAGIFFLVNEGRIFIDLAFVAGVALSVFGLTGILAYFIARRGLGLPAWMLADSLLTLLLSFVTLQNRIIEDDVALSVFGVWLMATGLMRVAGVVDMPAENMGFRIALLVIGLLSAAGGAYGFFRPFLPEIGMTGILGEIFILQGVSVFAVGAGISRKGPVKPRKTKGDGGAESSTKRSKSGRKDAKSIVGADEKTAASD
jgi:uncharacterized membrane protein HdeD (DUF308 family)